MGARELEVGLGDWKLVSGLEVGVGGWKLVWGADRQVNGGAGGPEVAWCSRFLICREKCIVVGHGGPR